MFESTLIIFLGCFWAAQAVLVFRDWLAQIVSQQSREDAVPLFELESTLRLQEVENCQFESDCPGVGLRDLLHFPVCLLYWILLFLFWPALIVGFLLKAWENCSQR